MGRAEQLAVCREAVNWADPDVTDHPSVPLILNRRIVCVDELLAVAVWKLNRLGVRTAFCCQGDTNARWLPDDPLDWSIAYLSLQTGHRFPAALLRAAKAAELVRAFNSLYAVPPMLPGDELRALGRHAFAARNRLFIRVLDDWVASTVTSVKIAGLCPASR
jgi:hypothetical protein